MPAVRALDEGQLDALSSSLSGAVVTTGDVRYDGSSFAEAAAIAQRADEGMMNRLLGQLLIPRDRDGHGEELAVAAAVDRLDLGAYVA